MFKTNFGTDPEIFVLDNDNSCIPPAALREDFGINFEDKITIISGDEWKIIEDGAATEINILPSDDPDIFFDRIMRAVSGAENFATKLGLKTTISPTVHFDTKRFWQGRGENFRDCVRFGCDPDLDIYSGEYSSEICADEIDERYGGGHIHMQAPDNNVGIFEDTYYHATRLMDILVGNTAVAFLRKSSEVEKEKARLKFYGRPGKIRLQDYPNGDKGIEYRTPSNFWLKDAKYSTLLLMMMECVFELINHPNDAVKFLDDTFYTKAPLNIVNFDQNSALKMLDSSLNLLGEMGYIDLGVFKLASNCVS